LGDSVVDPRHDAGLPPIALVVADEEVGKDQIAEDSE